MARKAANPTPLTIWRLNQGIQTGDIVAKTGLPQASVYRIERGDSISRPLANKYLGFWEGGVTNLKMFPEELQIIDEGWGVRISFKQQKTE